MTAPSPTPGNAPLQADRAALRRLGETVRARLAADPGVHRIAVTGAELFAVGDFLSAAECARFIALIDTVAQPSRTYDPVTQAEYRTSWSGDVERGDPFVRMIERRIDDLTGIDPAWGETVQGQRYRPGEEFRAHHDWFHPGGAYWVEEQARGGQRSWTAMIYLNDVPAGGETTFPQLGASITPRQGALLLWNNARPDGRPNDLTLHAALPVIAGTKYVITKWYRIQPWS